MTGTSKAILSMCVLLLAALVVYYGMAPQESVMGRQADLPTERQSKLGNNPGEEYIKKLGAPPIAADIKDEPISEASSVVEIEDVPETVLIDKPIVEKILENFPN